MAIRKPTQITSWSFSRYAVYKQCPLKAKLKFIDRIQEPGNEAMARGDAIHKTIESYLKGAINRVPKDLKPISDELKRVKALMKKKVLGPMVEDTWAFTKEWDVTRWDDWVNCWLRVKLDLATFDDEETLVVTDWKTGKFRDTEVLEYLEQLELYALAAFLRFTHVNKVYPRLFYTDQNLTYPPDEKPVIYTRSDLPKLRKTWEKRVAPMFKDKRFAPRPNDKCRWCHFRASNKANGGGQCRF